MQINVKQKGCFVHSLEWIAGRSPCKYHLIRRMKFVFVEAGLCRLNKMLMKILIKFKSGYRLLWV